MLCKIFGFLQENLRPAHNLRAENEIYFSKFNVIFRGV